MRIAVLSGKGGTGKTLISVNSAAAAGDCAYIDCDVEEPNGHLFFKPESVTEEPVTVGIPVVDERLCTLCRECVRFCRFNALALIRKKLYVFDEVCHACGGCALICPQKAITEKEKTVGKIIRGVSDQVEVKTGMLNTGEASGMPIIKKLLAERAEKLTFIDCPPGSACGVMESARDADYCVLVAEPTLFGVHNLEMVWELVGLFKKPFGAVLNKCLEGENPAENFCVEKGINILCRLPFDPELGALNSAARIAVRESEKYRAIFASLVEKITEEARHEATSDSER